MIEVKRSEELNELAQALSAFQGEVVDAHKDTQGYGYKYAKLDGVLEIVRPLLAKNGLAVTQLCGNANDDACVETMLMHKSGQWLSSVMQMPVTGNPKQSHAQCVGSIISYIRRYAITALLGITQTDDDAKGEVVQKQAKVLDALKVARMKDLIIRASADESAIVAHYQVNALENLTEMQFMNVVNKLEKKLGVE